MSMININPNTWTLIGDGDCVVISDAKTELVRFKLDNGESVSSYLNKQLLVKNIGDLFAKSSTKPITIKCTAADAAVRKNTDDIITINTALDSNAATDLETKNTLIAKDVQLEASISANSLADTNLAGRVSTLEGFKGKVVNTNNASILSVWVGSNVEYEAIVTKDSNTLYLVDE